MLHVFEPSADARGIDRIRRSPALPVFCAIAFGIIADRMSAISWSMWWIATASLVLVSGISIACRWRIISSLVLLGACGTLGGCWHHWCWSCTSENQIAAWAVDQGRLVRLQAKVLQAPLILVSEPDDSVPWRAPERTLSVVECRSLIGGAKEVVPLTGRVRMSVDGKLESLAVGDLIEVIGKIVLPNEPANPGEFDYRQWLRAQGLHASLAVEHVDAIQIRGRERSVVDWLIVGRAAIRRRAEDLMTSRLSPRTAVVAQSLLLGTRVELDRDLRRAFAESGTLHVLAISGMNVGLLWSWLWFVCRLLRASPRISLSAVLILLPTYALITDANPPVVRATIVAAVLAIGQLIGRNTSQWNSLALAAILVLAWNPCDLFNSGAQLSFVAVCSILLTTSFLKSFRMPLESDNEPIGTRSLWRMGWNWLFRSLVEGYIVSIGVWMMTSPLIASQFHLVSPIGFILNVLLSPLITLMFWLGYSFLLLGLVSPDIFGILGVPFDVTLNWFLSIIQAATFDLGHTYVTAPPQWWMIGFYALTVSFAIVDQWYGRIFWSARAALVWSVIGLAVSLQPGEAKGLRCTFLSVGHGLSVLLELPNGQTLLYDAGGMSGGTRTARSIESAIWSSGISRLDAIVVSHADADHCNAVPELVEIVPTRTLLVNRTFLDWTQPPVAAAIERSAAAGTSIQLLAGEQTLELDPNVEINVLHPSVDFVGKSDNSNSLVLCVTYAGKRIVLTGDIEKDGLVRLLKSERLHADILLSPHHGSLAANSRDLARWATPEWLIVSCRDDAVRDRLTSQFGSETQVLTTARFGAVRCEISPDGELMVFPFKNGQIR